MHFYFRYSKIKKCENLYESLREFKRCVEASESCFDTVNSQKGQMLSVLSNYSTTCRCAKKYEKGMGNTLSGIGVKVVGITYGALLLSIKLKMSAYISTIESYEQEIISLRLKVSRLNSEIEEARIAEELASNTR